MRILIDTNILIRREDNEIISHDLQTFFEIASRNRVQLLVHPLAYTEVENDKNSKRREITKSKLATYSLLENPPDIHCAEPEIAAILPNSSDSNEQTDNHLLYCLYRDAIDFLITEDKGIHRKSRALGINDRVYRIAEAARFLETQYYEPELVSPPAVHELSIHNLNLKDVFFDSLRSDYEDFEDWWRKIAREGRRAWVHRKFDGMIGGMLIYKKECEEIASNPPLPQENRLKICTLKASQVGFKLGELFLKLSIEYAMRNSIYEIYLTHHPSPNDGLVALIEEFGFRKKASKRGEEIFIKNLIPIGRKSTSEEIFRLYYPSYSDAKSIRKFIVPIRPLFHDRLFTEFSNRQGSLFEWSGELVVEGNTIKKAYLCHSKIKRMRPGDIVIFYRSIDSKRLTALGIVDRVIDELLDTDEILRYAAKRTVYSRVEIETLTKKPVKLLLFRHHFYLNNKLKLKFLMGQSILKGAPQTIMELNHIDYTFIKTEGGIDGRFAFGQA